MIEPCIPKPGGGISITIDIDLGDMLGCPPPPKPSTSLTCMPVDPMQPCDPDKLKYFNETNKPSDAEGCFGKAKDSVCGAFGGKPDKKPNDPDEDSFENKNDDKEKDKDNIDK